MRKFVLYLLTIGSILIMICCSKKREENLIRVITIRHGVIFPVSKVFPYLYTPIDSLTSGGFPTQNGDILSTDKSFLYVSPDLPDTLFIQELDSILIINDHISAISIEKGHPSPAFLRHISDNEIEYIRSITFSDSLTDDYKNQLTRIGKINPQLSIMVGNNDDYHWLLQNFDPKFLAIDFEMDTTTLSALTKLSHLETLLLFNGDLHLPKIKSLKHLMIMTDSARLSPHLFEENLHLERLSLQSDKLKIVGLPPWHLLKHLKELNINVDSLAPYPFSRYHPELKIVTTNTNENLPAIFELKNLQWLTLNENLSNQDFEMLTDSLQNLELLSITNEDSIRNYAALTKLSKLKYLTISEHVGLDTTLYPLKNLTFLSVPDHIFRDSLHINSLQRALPNTTITPNSGICMGSGWLLLLIPLTIVVYYIQQYISKRVTSTR